MTRGELALWLAYLRFDTDRDTRIAFVQCSNKAETEEVLQVAKALFGGLLAEYATFYSGRTIRPMQVPNFSEDLIFSYASFLQACRVKPGDSPQEPTSRPAQPPGSPGQTASPALSAGNARLIENG